MNTYPCHQHHGTYPIHTNFIDISNSICRYCGYIIAGRTSAPPSPIPELLGSNAIPTEAQEHSIRNAVDAASADLQRLEEEIRHVSSVLSKLRGERQALKEFADVHRAFLTPARRIYPEIWSEIFKHCSRGARRRRFAEVEDSFDPKEGPLVLTQICSAWRTIALATPQLWTTLRVTYSGHNASQLALVSAWLQRSGGLPLTVAVIEHQPTSYPKFYPALDWSEDEALHILCSSSCRWRRLYLMVPPSQLSWAAFALIRHELPSLQHLTVNTSRGTIPHKFNIDIFEDAPSLQTMSLDYTTTPSVIRVPFAQIKHLKFSLHKHTPASIHSCLTTLEMLPSVQECTFHMGACDPWIGLPTVHHSQLRRLTIIAESLRDNTQKGLGRFFDNLFVPNLKSLVVHSLANEREWDHYVFGHFLSRTPSLANLEIKCDNIKPNELLEELREATSVSSLTLSVPTQPTEKVLDYLSSTDAVNLLPFLVQLQSISFEGQAKPEFVYRIRNMIECRTMLAKMGRTANLLFVKYDFSSSPSVQLDFSANGSHGVDSRESLFAVTRQSASCIFRRRPVQVTGSNPFPLTDL